MQNNNKEEKYIDVKVTYNFRVDISDFDPEHVDIDGLAIDLTKREVDTLNSEDFNYNIIKKSYAEDYIKLISEGGSSDDPYVNIDGNLVTKTPELYPYNYDRFCIWRSANFDKKCKVIDSFEMWSRNQKLFAKVYKCIFERDDVTFAGQRVYDIERFLNLYFGTIGYKIKVIGVEQGCKNQNSYWYFYVKFEALDEFDPKARDFVNKLMEPDTDLVYPFASSYSKITLEELDNDIL